jgi:hypothetical protein
MQKRIADFLEKMSVGFMVGAYFQNSLTAVFFSLLSIGYSLYLTRRIENER